MSTTRSGEHQARSLLTAGGGRGLLLEAIDDYCWPVSRQVSR